MKKITKTEMKSIFANHTTTLFLKINNAIVTDEVLQDLIKKHTAEIFCIPSRKAEIKSNHVAFDDGSSLYANDNAYNTYTIYKYETELGIVIAVEDEWYDTFDKCTYYKTLYYMVH